MNLLKAADPGKRLRRDLNDALNNRDKLAERLSAANLAVIERQATAQHLACNGADDGVLDLAEVELRRSQDRVATLSAAIVETTAQVAALEEATAQAADKKLRAETASAIEAIADEITKAGATFDAGTVVLSEATDRAAAIIFEATGLYAFTARVRSEVPTTIQMITSILRDRARATIAGTAPASLPQPAPAPIEPPPPPKTERVFFLRHAKYRECGRLRLIPRFNDADLPPAVAARALAIGAAVPLSDPRRKQLCSQSPMLPNEASCQDLDAVGEVTK